MPYRGKPSKNCAPCRKRKIKCDLKSPSCSQCCNAGIVCPGYRNQLDLMFLDENERTEKSVLKRRKDSRDSKESDSGNPKPRPKLKRSCSVKPTINRSSSMNSIASRASSTLQPNTLSLNWDTEAWSVNSSRANSTRANSDSGDRGSRVSFDGARGIPSPPKYSRNDNEELLRELEESIALANLDASVEKPRDVRLEGYDPFAGLRASVKSEMKPMVNHSLHDFDGVLMSLKPGPEFQLRNFLSSVHNDPLQFYMMVWKSAAHLAGFQPQKFGTLAIHCGHKALQLLNERLGTGGHFDDTIACTILMLTAQAIADGNENIAHMHMRGLQALVAAQGGLHKCGLRRYNAESMFWTELMFAALTQTQPQFTYPPSKNQVCTLPIILYLCPTSPQATLGLGFKNLFHDNSNQPNQPPPDPLTMLSELASHLRQLTIIVNYARNPEDVSAPYVSSFMSRFSYAELLAKNVDTELADFEAHGVDVSSRRAAWAALCLYMNLALRVDNSRPGIPPHLLQHLQTSLTPLHTLRHAAYAPASHTSESRAALETQIWYALLGAVAAEPAGATATAVPNGGGGGGGGGRGEDFFLAYLHESLSLLGPNEASHDALLRISWRHLWVSEKGGHMLQRALERMEERGLCLARATSASASPRLRHDVLRNGGARSADYGAGLGVGLALGSERTGFIGEVLVKEEEPLSVLRDMERAGFGQVRGMGGEMGVGTGTGAGVGIGVGTSMAMDVEGVQSWEDTLHAELDGEMGQRRAGWGSDAGENCTLIKTGKEGKKWMGLG